MTPLTDAQAALMGQWAGLVGWAMNYCSKRYDMRPEEEPDCETAVIMGLARAARVFDPSRGLKFNTLAGNVMIRAALDSIKQQRRRKRTVWAQLQTPEWAEDGHQLAENLIADPRRSHEEELCLKELSEHTLATLESAVGRSMTEAAVQLAEATPGLGRQAAITRKKARVLRYHASQLVREGVLTPP